MPWPCSAQINISNWRSRHSDATGPRGRTASAGCAPVGACLTLSFEQQRRERQRSPECTRPAFDHLGQHRSVIARQSGTSVVDDTLARD